MNAQEDGAAAAAPAVAAVPSQPSAGKPPRRPPWLVATCRALVESTGFQIAIVGVILANAVLLGLATYPSITETAHGVIVAVEFGFLVVFVFELAVRLIAHGKRPQDFFRDGWNVFDFIVVVIAFVPVLGANSTLLRLARLARVMRVVRFYPALRTILIGVARSLPGLTGFLSLALLTLYLYGMVGWLMFGHSHPEQFGTLGTAALTLFVLLSLESLPDTMSMAVAEGPWAVLYFISYVLVASYLLINVLIGVVINSMEETRQAEIAEQLEEEEDEGHPQAELDRAALIARVEELRVVMQALEAELHVRNANQERNGPLIS